MRVSIKSEDAGNLVLERDTFSKGILNKDKSGYNEALARYEIARLKKSKEQNLEDRVNNMEQDLKDIKNMLGKLLNDRE